MTLTSRSSHGWRATNLRLKRPRSARILTWEQAHVRDKGSVKFKDLLPMEDATRDAPLSFSVTEAGREAPSFHGMRTGPGERHREEVFIYARRKWWSRKLLMKVTLLSIEPIERKMTIKIVRLLPH